MVQKLFLDSKSKRGVLVEQLVCLLQLQSSCIVCLGGWQKNPKSRKHHSGLSNDHAFFTPNKAAQIPCFCFITPISQNYGFSHVLVIVLQAQIRSQVEENLCLVEWEVCSLVTLCFKLCSQETKQCTFNSVSNYGREERDYAPPPPQYSRVNLWILLETLSKYLNSNRPLANCHYNHWLSLKNQ